MGMLQISPTSSSVFAGNIIPLQPTAVEYCTNWIQQIWTRLKYIEPLQAVECVAPAIGRASFRYRYGVIKREDSLAFKQYNDVNVDDFFIRIRSLGTPGQPVLWTGIVSAGTLMPGGRDTGSLQSNNSGDQTFEALELCHLLDRETIRTSRYRDANGNFRSMDDVPAANMRHRTQMLFAGNRSTLKDHFDSAYAFSAEGQEWTNRDLIEMLLARYAPQSGPVFQLAGMASVLDQLVDVTDLYLRTPWDVLNELVSRNRGLGFYPRVVKDKVLLQVFSMLDSSVSCGEFSLPANPIQCTLNLENSIDLQASIVRSTATKFDAVEVRGALILCCFTLSLRDGTLEPMWTPALDAEYKRGAADAPGYGVAPYDTNTAKGNLNDDYRRLDRFETVYTGFRVPKTWGGFVGDGAGGVLKTGMLSCNAAGVVDPASLPSFYAAGKAFERFLPMYSGIDYGISQTATGSLKADSEQTLILPFALIEDPSKPGKYLYVEKAGSGLESGAAHFGIYPRDLALQLGPVHRYIYGKNSFENDPAVEPFNDDPLFDYRSLLATVALRTDQAIKVTAYGGAGSSGGLGRTKLISVPSAEFWYCAPGTVVGLNPDGTRRLFAGDGVLRDDTDRLRAVAAFASAWYCAERSSVVVSVRRLSPVASLGTMIRGTYNAGVYNSVNTVVTSNTYLFEQVKVTTQTEWCEIDFNLASLPKGGTMNKPASKGPHHYVKRGFESRGFSGREFSGRGF